MLLVTCYILRVTFYMLRFTWYMLHCMYIVWACLLASHNDPSLMARLQATPDFDDKVFKLKGLACLLASQTDPSFLVWLQATHDFDDKVFKVLFACLVAKKTLCFWSGYRLHLILTTMSQNWKDLLACHPNRPFVLTRLQATSYWLHLILTTVS